MGEPNGTISVELLALHDPQRQVEEGLGRPCWRGGSPRPAPTVRTGSGSALMMRSLVGAFMPPPAGSPAGS